MPMVSNTGTVYCIVSKHIQCSMLLETHQRIMFLVNPPMLSIKNVSAFDSFCAIFLLSFPNLGQPNQAMHTFEVGLM